MRILAHCAAATLINYKTAKKCLQARNLEPHPRNSFKSLTTAKGRNIVTVLSNPVVGFMQKDQLQQIEQKVDRLIALCSRLHQENQTLREREANLLQERSKLIEKNEQARNRVEGMITRLKGLNSES